jgi:hypothetical protein
MGCPNFLSYARRRAEGICAYGRQAAQALLSPSQRRSNILLALTPGPRPLTRPTSSIAVPP